MVDTWGEIDVDEADVQDEVYDKKLAFDKVFLHCIATSEGSAMLELLRARLVDIKIYEQGATLEATAYRQGRADVVAMIDKCVEDALK